MSTSGWVIICAFVLWIGVTVTENDAKKPGISTQLQSWARSHTWFGFMWGCLIGHWFIPLKELGFSTVTYWPYLLIPIGILAGMDAYHRSFTPLPSWSRYPGIYPLIGIPFGALLWAS